MSDRIPSATLFENVRYNLTHVLPLVLQGTFTRSRFWTGLFSRLQRDPGAVRLYQLLRRKYQSDYIYLRLVTTKILVVMGMDGVQRVLAGSPYVYADGKNKRKGMSHFQPDAVTISRGKEWDHRRHFNDRVLDYGKPVHRHADAFLRIVRDEIVSMTSPPRESLGWSDFEQLFGRITRQVIFGRHARDDTEVTRLLTKLMRQANRPVRIRTRHFTHFYRKVGVYLGAATPRDATLAGVCVGLPRSDRTRVEGQIPHWIFAMYETLAINTVRAFALIVAHPHVCRTVRREMAEGDRNTAAGVHGLKYLEGIVNEAMRLWPTTGMFIREVIDDATLGGHRLAYGTQVLIPNTLHHRDQERYPRADEFTPEVWVHGTPSPLFNHMGAGPQTCAGRELALFLAKSVLANLLALGDYTLRHPTFAAGKPLPRAFDHFRVRFNGKFESSDGH